MLFEETMSKYFDLYERKMQVILMCILFIVINDVLMLSICKYANYYL